MVHLQSVILLTVFLGRPVALAFWMAPFRRLLGFPMRTLAQDHVPYIFEEETYYALWPELHIGLFLFIVLVTLLWARWHNKREYRKLLGANDDDKE